MRELDGISTLVDEQTTHAEWFECSEVGMYGWWWEKVRRVLAEFQASLSGAETAFLHVADAALDIITCSNHRLLSASYALCTPMGAWFPRVLVCWYSGAATLLLTVSGAQCTRPVSAGFHIPGGRPLPRVVSLAKWLTGCAHESV